MMPLVLVGLIGASARVGADNHRPLLGQPSLEVLTQMETARAESYQQVGDVVADTDDGDVKTAAGLIVSALGAGRYCA
jgi:shikimate kinase